MVKSYLVAVRPGTGDDVAETVKYAREQGVLFSPRAGHHCVTTTMRHLKNGILIDMRSLNSLTFDQEKRHVTVGGGVITDYFVRFLESKNMEVSKSNNGTMPISVTAIIDLIQRCRFLPNNWCHGCRLRCRSGEVAGKIRIPPR